ncbi:MAG: hypothetical protein HY748_12610 [Elusimicrobia bacterium]|nr:hypothetical protein [Elusimicrobiota bacterium]
MNRQRRLSSTILLAAASFAVAVLSAEATDMSIDSVYVMVGPNCGYVAPEANSVGVKFTCPIAAPSDPSLSNCSSTVDTFDATIPGAGSDGWVDRLQPGCGNVSNDPRIEFETNYRGTCWYSSGPNFRQPASQYGTVGWNVCNSTLFLCTALKYVNTETLSGGGCPAIPVNEMTIEIFKFVQGQNQNNATEAPPVKSYFIDNPGNMTVCNTGTVMSPVCVAWDGAQNIQGELGKTNGTYGFRVKAKVQTQNPNVGNITITAERTYPSGTALDSNNTLLPQKPVTLDVTNVHVISASPTVVGRITGVQAEPYNFTYRLTKDSTMYIRIYNAVDVCPTCANPNPIRNLIPGLPRMGEGTPSGTLLNGDSWNGRADNGDFMPPGIYLAAFEAFSVDQFGRDLSYQTTREIGLDPLHVTDLRTLPLLAGSTSLATLTYVLTEPATVYIDIYPPNTQFCGNTLNRVNDGSLDQTANPSLPPKDFQPRTDSCAGAAVEPLRRIIEAKMSRMDVVSFWDGTDRYGNALPDGDYVFVLYASLPSQNGPAFGGVAADRRIWTSMAKVGALPVVRSLVGITQVTPASTVIGSSPAVAGVNPFYFKYTLSREAIVTLKVYDASGKTLVKTLVEKDLRPGLFLNQEVWSDAANNEGTIVTSGTYLVQLTAADPMFPAKVSTTTALFPVNLFRITDVFTGPLLSGASDVVTLTYQLSQTMNLAWNIYNPGTIIVRSSSTWPPCGKIEPQTGCDQILKDGVATQPVITMKGLRVGRQRYTETWDGRDSNGLYVPDGSYVFTVTAESTTTPHYFATDRIIGSISVARGQIVFTSFAIKPEIPDLYNSSNTIQLHPYTVEYGLTRQSSVTIQIMTAQTPATVVRTVIAGQVRDGGILLQDTWDGRDDRGNFPRSGFYNVRVVAEDMASVLASGSTAQMTITYDPLRIYDVAVAPLRADSPAAIIAYQVSEAMKISLKIYKPGTIFDGVGNPSPAESVSLVKRIVGIRPARTLIEESWNGTDLKQAVVPDGNYKFKLVASTDPAAIDDMTGNVLNPAALASDRPIDEIPVARLGSVDPFADFQTNTYIYPNPVVGSVGHIRIYVPFQGLVKVRFYTMSGGLAWEKDFGEKPLDSYVEFDWNKTNLAGRAIARGMYWAVFRVEETLGGRNVLQVVKKFLIP